MGTTGRDDVLNEALYFKLKSQLGAVKVVNPGQAMVSRVTRDFLTDRLTLQIEQPGEYYVACCPYCTDTRFRLYVSHMFGQKDDAGRPMHYAVICYNEGCLQNEENWRHFVYVMNSIPGLLQSVPVKKGTVLPEEARKKSMPGPCTEVHKLPPTHPANSYLISRKFDPMLLGGFYGVSYCHQSKYLMAAKRIVVPVLMHGELVGWQGRFVGERDWKKTNIPKYFTCPGMDRRFILGNYDVATRFHTGVLVEGWFDVFNTGPMAMCMFGSTLTSYQHREFVSAFGKRSGVYMVDPEEFPKATTERTVARLKEAMSGNLVTVILPEGIDPGKMPREYLRRYIEHHAKAQGVPVSWERVS